MRIYNKKRLSHALCLAIVFGSNPLRSSQAGELLRSEVQKNNDRYSAHIEVLIGSAQEEVWRRLSNFEHLPELHPGIQTVTLLPTNNADEQRMQVIARVCVWFYCRHYRWVQRVTIDRRPDSVELTAVIEPKFSDFKQGLSRYWIIAARERQTRLVFAAELIPDFWLPPLIDRWLIERKLVTEALAIAAALENSEHR